MKALSVESSDRNLLVQFPKDIPMGREEFFDFCQANGELRIERDAVGNIIVMSPTGIETGGRNASLTSQVYVWTRNEGGGKSFDSSAAFELPNGATRSPDVSWLSPGKWNALPAEERGRFARVCPDFVIQLRSRTDRLSVLQAKMEEYIANGAKLGFLIDPQEGKVAVYRPGKDAEIQNKPMTLSAEPEMPGLVLDLEDVW